MKQVLPALARARAAGIATLSYELRSPGSVWVNQAAPAQFAQALADALASQMNQQGQFVIVSCLRSAGAYPIVGTFLKLAKAYIQRRYPQMQRVGVAYGDLGNGDVDTHLFNRLMRAHPQLRGLIFLCPGEADNQPPLLVQANKVGEVFTAGNGFGLGVSIVEDTAKGGGRGVGAFAWGGAYGTESWADPELGVAAAMFIQMQPAPGNVKSGMCRPIRIRSA